MSVRIFSCNSVSSFFYKSSKDRFLSYYTPSKWRVRRLAFIETSRWSSLPVLYTELDFIERTEVTDRTDFWLRASSSRLSLERREGVFVGSLGRVFSGRLSPRASCYRSWVVIPLRSLWTTLLLRNRPRLRVLLGRTLALRENELRLM